MAIKFKLFLLLLLFALSCDKKQSEGNDSTFESEIEEKRNIKKGFFYANHAIPRYELPIPNNDSYDLIRFHFDYSTKAGHTYSILKHGNSIVSSYKCKIRWDFCSFGTSYEYSDISEEWKELVRKVRSKAIREMEDERHKTHFGSGITVTLEVLLNGEYFELYVDSYAKEDEIWGVLGEIYEISSPELPQDSFYNELKNQKCPCKLIDE